MDLNTLLPDLITIIGSGAVSTVTTVLVMNERVKNIKANFDEHKQESQDQFAKLRSEIFDTMSGCRLNSKERVDSAVDYIKRVELNKADKSEVNLVIDATKRIEQKLDLLILRDSK